LAGTYVPLNNLAVAQEAVFSLGQLMRLGLTASGVRKRQASGRLHRVHPAVYSLVPPALLTRRGRYVAAVLACGDGAALSYRSAADLHGLRHTDRPAIEVTVTQTYGRRIRGIQVHRSRTLTPDDVTEVAGILCTTVARTLLDLAAVVGRRPLERAVEQAEVQEVLDYAALVDQLDRNRTTRGGRRLRALLADRDDHGDPTESELEERFLALCRAAGLPVPGRQVHINPDDGEPPLRVDFAWGAQRLIVETDGGRYHRTHRAFESDRRRDQRLTLAGWRVLRITWRQLRDEPERVARTIARALRLP
jgi:hypothetical protein